MYNEFFGFREPPFNITPDPRFLYLNDCYQEAVAALGYGIQGRKGFISLIGEAGTGKTTMLRHVLDSIEPTTRTVLLLNPMVTFEEILEHTLLELGVPTDGGAKLVRLQRLNEYLIEHTAAGGNVALLIDEAQDVDPGVLEELRLLSNLETAREKIIQIVLAGQPELRTILADTRLRQLRQRIALHIRLSPLTPPEVTEYVRSRLERAGAADLEVFSPEALARLAACSEGVPRLVNVLCDASLMIAFAAGSRRVTAAVVDEAWRDYAGEEEPAAPAVAATSQPLAASSGAVSAVAAPRLAPAPRPVAPVPPPRLEPPPAPRLAAPIARAEVPIAPRVEREAPPRAEPAPAPRPYLAPPPQAPPAAPSGPGVWAAEPPPVRRPEPLPPVARLESAPAPARPEPARVAAPPEPARLVVSGGRPEPAPARGLPLLATVAVLLAVVAYLGRSVLADLNVDLAPLAATANAYLERGLRLLEGSPPPSEEPTVAAPAVVTPSPAVAAPAAVLGKPIGAAEAAAVVEQFRGAFEARDVDGLVRLFAPDAVENGRRGVQAIAAGYRASLPALAEVHYELTRFVVEPQGSRTEVRGPFVISYLRANNDRGELRGEAVFELERRDGLPRITRLDYRADAAQASAPRTPPR